MVNTGLPSRDCDTCRRRRVKCDLRRPGCLRCEKIGQSCSGYRNLETRQLVFRVQTLSSYNSRHNPRKHHPSLPEKNSGGANTVTNTGETSCVTDCGHLEDQPHHLGQPFWESPWELSPPRQMIEPWDIHIIPLIVSQFSFQMPGGSSSYGPLACLRDLLQCAEANSVLYMACNAVGYAYLANKSHSAAQALSHTTWYGKALGALRKDLQVPDLQKQDSILLAVWLLCFYELVHYDPSSDGENSGPIRWDMHTRALVGLLRLRGLQQFKSLRGCQMFQLAYFTIQINTFQSRRAPPPEAFEWFMAMQPHVKMSKISSVPLLLYSDEAAHMCSSIRCMVENDSKDTMLSAAIDIIQACDDLESRMKDYYGDELTCPSLSSAAQPVVVEEEKQNFEQKSLLRCRNYIDAIFLRLHYGILELLFHAAKLLRLSTYQREDIARLRQVSILQSQARAERILVTLPIFMPQARNQPVEVRETFLPNWADSLRLLWQIRLVASSPVVHERQKISAKSALSRMGYEVGIMQALGAYYSNLTAYESL